MTSISIWGLIGLCCLCALLGAGAALLTLKCVKKPSPKTEAPQMLPRRAQPSQWRRMGRDEQFYNGR